MLRQSVEMLESLMASTALVWLFIMTEFLLMDLYSLIGYEKFQAFPAFISITNFSNRLRSWFFLGFADFWWRFVEICWGNQIR